MYRERQIIFEETCTQKASLNNNTSLRPGLFTHSTPSIFPKSQTKRLSWAWTKVVTVNCPYFIILSSTRLIPPERMCNKSWERLTDRAPLPRMLKEAKVLDWLSVCVHLRVSPFSSPDISIHVIHCVTICRKILHHLNRLVSSQVVRFPWLVRTDQDLKSIVQSWSNDSRNYRSMGRSVGEIKFWWYRAVTRNNPLNGPGEV